jgi:hypothetical protein
MASQSTESRKQDIDPNRVVTSHNRVKIKHMTIFLVRGVENIRYSTQTQHQPTLESTPHREPNPWLVRQTLPRNNTLNNVA